jgi:hypothetical protein
MAENFDSKTKDPKNKNISCYEKKLYWLYTLNFLSLFASILVPRASVSRASSPGPGTHGTGSSRKLAVVFKAHALELGRFSTRNNFHSKYYEETKYLCWHLLIE